MKVTSVSKAPRRYGFTLVELVVVVLIMGIIAAVALPKMTTTTVTAKESAAKQSLAVVRDALELFKANSDDGKYPALATLSTDLSTYLKGPFPSAPGSTNAVVAGTTNPPTKIGAGGGWAYHRDSGEFYINDDTNNKHLW